MTRRYFVQGALALFALTVVGCSKGDKDDKTPTGGVKETGKPDDDDKVFDTDEGELLPGEQWEEASPVDVTAQLKSKYRFTARGYVDQALTELINASKSVRTYGVRNGGRQAFRLNPRFAQGRRAVVVFSDQPRAGYRITLGKANRVNSGTHRGFVFKNSSSMNGYFAHSPYGRRPTTITVYY